MKNGRKYTGAKYHAGRKKRLYEIKGKELKPILGDSKKKTVRVRGGNFKQKLLRSNIANLSILGKSKTEKVKINNVIETPQNVFFARQNVLLKGAIIETSKGKAKITNRPTQEGIINAILLEK